MNIILNEREWAEDAILTSTIGRKPYETLNRIARYYFDNGATYPEVLSLIESFVLQCDPHASIPKWTQTIEYAVSAASKRDTIKIDAVAVTKPEMDKIDSIDSKPLRRVAFALLCLAKYWDIVNKSGDHWVNNKDGEVMKMANVGASIRRQSSMYRELRDLGMIQFSKRVDNTNVRVCFVDDSADKAVDVSDFRNLGYQYLMYHGGPFVVCQNCGLVIKKNNASRIVLDGRPARGVGRRYCPDCMAQMTTAAKVNSVMKI